MNKTFDSEKLSGIQGHISGIQSNISAINANLTDFTSVQIMTTVNVSTGATLTATIINIGGWAVNNLYLALSASAALAAASGVSVSMFGRGSSGTPWTRFITNSNYDFSGNKAALIPIRGSGTDMSGQYYFGDLKVEVFNGSSSGTALVNAFVMSKRQN